MAKDKSLRISSATFSASRNSANKLTEAGCLYYNVLVMYYESAFFIKWLITVDVSMTNPDVLELLPVCHTMRNFDLKQFHSTVRCEGAVVFCYWRHKTFRFGDMRQKGREVCMCMP